MRRTAVALLAASGLVLSLAACSTPTTEDNSSTGGAGAESCAAATVGEVDGVKVSGDFGSKPSVEIDGPLSPESTERAVSIAGDGATAVAGDQVRVQYTIYNATSGDVLDTSDYTEGSEISFELDEQQYLPGLIKTLNCAVEGSRVVGVIPPVDSWGVDGSEQAAQLGVAVDDSIVFVADVVGIVPPLKVVDYEDLENAPEVTFAADGVPTAVIPDSDPPATTEIGLISKGDGAVVGENADVVVHYRGYIWNTGEIFDESYKRGEPTPFNTGGVVAGFGAAIEGQTVGSRLVAIVAPEDGYGAAGSGELIKGTDTLVFIIEIVE
jgi:peptidylprolyl isomerase